MHCSDHVFGLFQVGAAVQSGTVLACMQGKGGLCKYDPRDLFSQEPSRVLRALWNLVDIPNVRSHALDPFL